MKVNRGACPLSETMDANVESQRPLRGKREAARRNRGDSVLPTAAHLSNEKGLDALSSDDIAARLIVARHMID
jgi:hypothetical protein